MWTVVNDPHAPGGRNFPERRRGRPEIPPAAASALPPGRPRDGHRREHPRRPAAGFAAAFLRATPCTTADCGDDDPCTTDSCVEGACKNTEDVTVASVQCELDQASGLDCGHEDPEAAHSGFAAGSPAKLGRATKARKMIAKLQSAIDKLLAGVSTKVRARRTPTPTAKPRSRPS